MATLAPLDFLLLLGYALIVALIGWRAARNRPQDTGEFLLASRSIGWLPVALSIVATAASALTFIGVPGAGFQGNLGYVQFGLGSLVARCLVAALLLPAFYAGRVTTVYELLGQRFGPLSHASGTLFFLVTRLLASSVRLLGVGIAISVVLQVPLPAAVSGIALLAVLYTTLGGIRAVIWTDVVQFGLLVGAPLVALWVIVGALPGGLGQLWDLGQEAGKFQVFDWSFDPTNANAFPAAFLGGLCLSLAAFGTDHDLVQRMLTCRSLRGSQRAIILTGIFDFPMSFLFLGLGVALFVFYQVFPAPEVAALVAEGKPDYVFPHFIVAALPAGLRGLLLAALLAAAMSSLDSAMTALSSSAVVDLYRPLLRAGETNPRQELWISRFLVIGFALALVTLALAFKRSENILWVGLKIGTFTYGSLLGVFLTAVTGRRGTDWGNLVAMFSGLMVVALLYAYSPLAWEWFIVAGTLWTWGVGSLFGGLAAATAAAE
jgi:SSS family transporter